MKSSDRSVFILGAGCSKALSNGVLPITSELKNQLNGDNIFKEASRKYGEEDLDILLTRIDLEIRSKEKKENTKDEIEKLKSDSEHLESLILKQFKKGEITELSKKFASFIPKNSTLITFNYDLLIEKSLWALRRWIPRGGYGKVLDYLDPTDQNNEGIENIVMLKLHGSVNFDLLKFR